MVHFVGAGPGATDLITLRGARLLGEADVIIYAGSLVNPELLSMAKETCKIYNSAEMTLEEVLAVMQAAEDEGLTTVRLHTGDMSLYGAIREQIDPLEERGIAYDLTPGVSSCFGGAAALGAEFTLPGVSQSLVITRMEGKTPVPEREKLREFAKIGCSMALFLSASLTEAVQDELLAGAFTKDTPAALVYKATWPEQRIARCTVGTLAETARRENMTKTTLIYVGDFLDSAYDRSLLYHPGFTTEFRKGTGEI